jgi:hypothetical protein
MSQTSAIELPSIGDRDVSTGRVDPDRLSILAAIVACGIALATALYFVHGLQWPYADDNYRDIAQAQATLDGHPFSDPFFAGEWIWYNPLLPWIVALGASLTDTSLATFHVQSGPWLNLSGPILFYLVAVRLTGRHAALVALVFFLFVNGQTDSSRDHSTYGPWLYTASFAQGLFYATVLALQNARVDGTLRSALFVGGSIGLTLLTHTGPALVLALVTICVLTPRSWTIAGITAAIVASPYLYPLVVHYGGQVRNVVPMAGGMWLTASIVRFPELVWANVLLIGCAAAGLFLLRDRILGAWLAVSLALVGYGLWCDRIPELPRIVPTFHFWRYAGAALTVYAGAAVWFLIRRLATSRAELVASAIAIVAVGAAYPRYLDRPDFWGRALSQQRTANAWVAPYLRDHTAADEVVLAPTAVSLQLVGPAGRRVVALHPIFSNPYVDPTTRLQDHTAMFDALRAGDSQRFITMAGRYGIGHVAAGEDSDCDELNRSPLVLMKREGHGCVFSVAR